MGDIIRGFRSQNTIHYPSSERRLYCCDYWSGDDGKHIFRSQETNHSYFQNSLEIVDGDGRGAYRSQTSHSTSHNPGELVILSGLYFSSCPVVKSVHGDDIVVYRSHTSCFTLSNGTYKYYNNLRVRGR